MANLMSTEMLFRVQKSSVLTLLHFILYFHDMWFGQENMLIIPLLPCIPSAKMRSGVNESLNRDLGKISA